MIYNVMTSGMNAFFSGVDDRDDNRDRYSGVIGKLNNVIPDHKFRFGTLGKFYDVEMDNIFEDSDEHFDIDHKEAVKNLAFNQAVKVENKNVGFKHVSIPNGFGIPRSGYANLWNKLKV